MKKHGMIGEIQKVKTKQKDDYLNHLSKSSFTLSQLIIYH